MADNSQFQRDYFCTRCGKRTDRDKLTVKKAVFTDMGSRAKTHKSRVIRALCPKCLPTDADWQKPGYSEPDFEVMPEGFEDEEPSTQLELPLEPAHLLERR